MDILIGTKNPYKVDEMMYFLKDIKGLKIHLLRDMDIELCIEENGKSLIDNAEKKALEISKLVNMYVLTSDGGVDIPPLGDKWDILRNQRIVGENNSDVEKAKKLLSLMKDLKGEQRRVVYTLAMTLAKDGNILWSGEDITDVGYIIEDLVDEDIPEGRWAGQIWYYPKYGKVHNELNMKELDDRRKMGKEMKEEIERVIGEIRQKE